MHTHMMHTHDAHRHRHTLTHTHALKVGAWGTTTTMDVASARSNDLLDVDRVLPVRQSDVGVDALERRLEQPVERGVRGEETHPVVQVVAGEVARKVVVLGGRPAERTVRDAVACRARRVVNGREHAESCHERAAVGIVHLAQLAPDESHPDIAGEHGRAAVEARRDAMQPKRVERELQRVAVRVTGAERAGERRNLGARTAQVELIRALVRRVARGRPSARLGRRERRRERRVIVRVRTTQDERERRGLEWLDEHAAREPRGIPRRRAERPVTRDVLVAHRDARHGPGAAAVIVRRFYN